MVEQAAAAQAERESRTVQYVVHHLRGQRREASQARALVARGQRVRSVALHDAAVLHAVIFRNHVLGLHDRRFKLGELRLLSDRVVVDLLLERNDLCAVLLRFRLELYIRGGAGLDFFERGQDLFLDL